MKTKYLIALLLPAAILLSNCNKEKKVMKRLEGNWSIETSERSIMYPDGSTAEYENVSNAGTLVIYKDPNGTSDESMLYDFTYVSSNGDTLKASNVLVTDEKKNRIIMQKALNDSTFHCDLSWTIEKTKKNKQIWSIYGVDSTYYYPTNNQNPGAARNWLEWKMTLKREK